MPMIAYDGGLSGLGFSWEDLTKNPGLLAAVAGGAGVVAGVVGYKYGGGIWGGLKTAGSAIGSAFAAPVVYLQQQQALKMQQVKAERELYAGHVASWWTARGLKPGDTAGLASQRREQAAKAAGYTTAQMTSMFGVSAASAAKVSPANPFAGFGLGPAAVVAPMQASGGALSQSVLDRAGPGAVQMGGGASFPANAGMWDSLISQNAPAGGQDALFDYQPGKTEVQSNLWPVLVVGGLGLAAVLLLKGRKRKAS
jgi:hypothetical protein